MPPTLIPLPGWGGAGGWEGSKVLLGQSLPQGPSQALTLFIYHFEKIGTPFICFLNWPVFTNESAKKEILSFSLVLKKLNDTAVKCI